MATNSIFHDVSPKNQKDTEKFIETLETSYHQEISDPNVIQCDTCGYILTSESCYCPECKTWLCIGCAFENECDERQE